MKIFKSATIIAIATLALTTIANAQSANVELSQLVPTDVDAYYEINTGVANPLTSAIQSAFTNGLQSSTGTLSQKDQQALTDIFTNELKNNKITMAMKTKTVTTPDGSYSYPSAEAYFAMHLSTDGLKKLTALSSNNLSKQFADSGIGMIGDLLVVTDSPETLQSALNMYNRAAGSSLALAQNNNYLTARQKDLPGSFWNMYINGAALNSADNNEVSNMLSRGYDSLIKYEGVSITQTTTGYNFSLFMQADDAKVTELNINFNRNDLIPQLYKWVNSQNVLFFSEQGNLQSRIQDVIKLNSKNTQKTKEFNDFKASLKTDANLDFDNELMPLLKNQYAVALHQTNQIYPAGTFMMNVGGDFNATNHNEADGVAASTTVLAKVVNYVDTKMTKMEKDSGLDFYNKISTSFNGSPFYQMTFDFAKMPEADGQFKNLPREKTIITVNAGITSDGVLIITTAPDVNTVYTIDKKGMLNNANFNTGFGSNPNEIVNGLIYADFDAVHSYASMLLTTLNAPKDTVDMVNGLLAPWHNSFIKTYASTASTTVKGSISVDNAGLAKYVDLFSTFSNSQIPADGELQQLPLEQLPDFGPLPLLTPLMNAMENPRFCDVHYSDWYSKYVNKLADDYIVKGYEDGCFHPNKSITRAEFVKMVLMANGMDTTSMMGESAFNDLGNGTMWYDNYINTAAANNLINGYSDGSFRPNKPITRAEAIQLLYNMSSTLREINTLGMPTSSLISFKDVHSSDWFMPAVAGAYHNGLIQGDANKMFNPNRNLTRAEAAKIIKLFRDLMKDEQNTIFLQPTPVPTTTVAPAPMPSLSPTPMYPAVPVQLR